MAKDLLSFQVDEMSKQMQRLCVHVDKICDRIASLEKDKEDREFRTKLWKFLAAVYPLLMFVIIVISGLDLQKTGNILQKSNAIIDHMEKVI